MPPEELLYPPHWLRIAEKDLRRVERALRDDDPELAGFCLQQAVEKFLQGFLLSRGWKLKRTHDPEALGDTCIAHDPTLQEFRAPCQKITGFYVIERYPGVGTGLTVKEVQDSLESVRGLVEKLRKATSA